MKVLDMLEAIWLINRKDTTEYLFGDKTLIIPLKTGQKKKEIKVCKHEMLYVYTKLCSKHWYEANQRDLLKIGTMCSKDDRVALMMSLVRIFYGAYYFTLITEKCDLKDEDHLYYKKHIDEFNIYWFDVPMPRGFKDEFGIHQETSNYWGKCWSDYKREEEIFKKTGKSSFKPGTQYKLR
jgi:hypothetical protein